jgi:hypothetical protein
MARVASGLPQRLKERNNHDQKSTPGIARSFAAVAMAALGVALFAPSGFAQSQTLTHAQQRNMEQAKAREAQAKTLLAKYTATPGREDSDGLLKEPAVRAELQRVVGISCPS